MNPHLAFLFPDIKIFQNNRPLRYLLFADVTVWLHKCLYIKPFDAISPVLFGYSGDYS